MIVEWNAIDKFWTEMEHYLVFCSFLFIMIK